MVGHAYYVVDRVSPYGLLGMIHVLEGMAVALAGKAVSALRESIGAASEGGFKYLTTHGDLDVRHSRILREPDQSNRSTAFAVGDRDNGVTFTSCMAICFVISTSAARQLLLREPGVLSSAARHDFRWHRKNLRWRFPENESS